MDWRLKNYKLKPFRTYRRFFGGFKYIFRNIKSDNVNFYKMIRISSKIFVDSEFFMNIVM